MAGIWEEIDRKSKEFHRKTIELLGNLKDFFEKTIELLGFGRGGDAEVRYYCSLFQNSITLRGVFEGTIAEVRQIAATLRRH